MDTLEKVQNIVHFKERAKQIVQIIVQNRKEANLTQNELAEMLKIDRRKIISLESGNFDLNIMLIASDLLGITVTINFEID